MTELVPVNYEMMWKVSQRVTNTPFVPKGLQGKPEAVLACILYGAEMGIGPMQSLNSIHVIEGRAAMSPELMRAMVARHGHRIDLLRNDSEVCEMRGERTDTGSTATVKWTMEDARLAGLAGKNNWKTYPRAMLLARCTSELCRILFPDIIAGLSYTPEEVASIEGVEYTEPEQPRVVSSNPDAVLAEIVETGERTYDAVITLDEEEPEEKPKKKKAPTGTAVKDVAENLIAEGIVGNSTTPSFEERLRIAESWGGWPLVKGIASMLSKAIGCDKPETFPELAHNEALWLRVQEAMRERGK